MRVRGESVWGVRGGHEVGQGSWGWRSGVRASEEAAAAGFLLLGLDVVVDLEPGLVGPLNNTVLQLPAGDTW